MENYGIAHVWAQGDFVTRGIALALVIMSVLSWTVIVVKAWNVVRLKRLTKNAEQAFWHSDDFNDGIKKLGSQSSSPADNPFLALALAGQEAADHHHQTQPHLHDRMDVSDWITRCLKDVMDEGVGRMQAGLAILASIGSVAVRRPLRYGLGHLSRALDHRRDGTDVDRSGRRSGRRIAHHDGVRPVRRDSRRARL